MNRLDHMEMVQQYDRLAEHPSAQAEAIANHYSSLAALACDLRELTLRWQLTGRSFELRCLIDQQVELIKDAHRRDLGIELVWPRSESAS